MIEYTSLYIPTTHPYYIRLSRRSQELFCRRVRHFGSWLLSETLI